jgi:hypothetical protein
MHTPRLRGTGFLNPAGVSLEQRIETSKSRQQIAN